MLDWIRSLFRRERHTPPALNNEGRTHRGVMGEILMGPPRQSITIEMLGAYLQSDPHANTNSLPLPPSQEANSSRSEEEDIAGGWENAHPPFQSHTRRIASDFGVHTRPRISFPKKATYEKRLSTFKKWPSNHPHQPGTLAALGFFLKKRSWSLYCFACGHSISYLEPGEDIGERHRRIFPHCLFAQCSDQIQTVDDDITQEIQIEKTNKEDLLCKIRELQDHTLCKVCLANKLNIAMAPCGHLICNQCLFVVHKCPMCRENIKGIMKIYFN